MKEKKAKTNVLDYDVLKEIISPDNVLEMAEGIAFAEVRYLIGYIGSRMQKMYADLYDDMVRRNEPTIVVVRRTQPPPAARQTPGGDICDPVLYQSSSDVDSCFEVLARHFAR